MEKNYTQNLDKVIKIDDANIKDPLGEMVRGTVEETLNKMLAAEADLKKTPTLYKHSASFYITQRLT